MYSMNAWQLAGMLAGCPAYMYASHDASMRHRRLWPRNGRIKFAQKGFKIAAKKRTVESWVTVRFLSFLYMYSLGM